MTKLIETLISRSKLLDWILKIFNALFKNRHNFLSIHASGTVQISPSLTIRCLLYVRDFHRFLCFLFMLKYSFKCYEFYFIRSAYRCAVKNVFCPLFVALSNWIEIFIALIIRIVDFSQRIETFFAVSNELVKCGHKLWSWRFLFTRGSI